MLTLSSGLIGGLVASLLFAVAKARLPNAWFTFGVTALAFGASAFLFYVYVFVGSSRPDAEIQMRYCLGLAIAFLVCAIIIPVWSLWAARTRDHR